MPVDVGRLRRYWCVEGAHFAAHLSFCAELTLHSPRIFEFEFEPCNIHDCARAIFVTVLALSLSAPVYKII